MLRGHVPGTCCSNTPPRVSWYFYFHATRILLQFCPRDMSHEVQLVELYVCGTCCRDKTLQRWDVPSCALLRNAFMQQNQHFSQSQTTTRIIRPLALGKRNMAAMDSGVRFDSFSSPEPPGPLNRRRLGRRALVPSLRRLRGPGGSGGENGLDCDRWESLLLH